MNYRLGEKLSFIWSHTYWFQNFEFQYTPCFNNYWIKIIFLLRWHLYMLYILIQYCYYTIVLLLIFKNSLFIFLGMWLRVGQVIEIWIGIRYILTWRIWQSEKAFETQDQGTNIKLFWKGNFLFTLIRVPPP